MAKKKTEIVQVPETADVQTADSFIEKAIAVGAPVETLERLFDLQLRAKADKSRELFVSAMTGFQQDCPIIEKKKKVMNKDGSSIRYMFAPIDSIVTQIKPFLLKHGLSYRWEVDTKDNKVTAKAIVTHISGHSESSSFEVPVESSQWMTSTQSNASALTFAKRYSLCNALGIATGDEDTDALDAGQKDAKDPKAKIINRLKALKEKVGTKEEIEDAVFRLAKLKLDPSNFDEIITRLEVVISERHENS